MSTKRLDPEVRREQILDAALRVAERDGYDRMTRVAVAVTAKCSGATVQYYYTSMDQLRRCVMRAAVRKPVLPVLAQGLARRDRIALRADPELRRRALEALA